MNCIPLSVSLSLFRYTDLPMEDYLCPVLRGCTVCVTGLSSAERKEVQRLCEQHGANYTGQLKMNECTHLIVSEPTGTAPSVQAIYSYANLLDIRNSLFCLCSLCRTPCTVLYFLTYV